MLVYRIEKNSQGAWHSGVVWQAERYADTGFCAGHGPGPCENRERDTKLYEVFNNRQGEPYHFGFSSLDQYERWFHCPRFRKGLAEAGAKLVVYDVSSRLVAEGNWQVAFQIKHARKVAELCPYRCLRARKGYFTITMSAALAALGRVFNPETQQELAT